jgi:hypothetical protein
MMNESITAAGDLVVSDAVAEIGTEGSAGLDPTAESAAVVESRRSQRGLVSAEWAVAIIAAIALAGVLLTVVTSAGVERALLAFVEHVISTFGKK